MFLLFNFFIFTPLRVFLPPPTHPSHQQNLINKLFKKCNVSCRSMLCVCVCMYVCVNVGRGLRGETSKKKKEKKERTFYKNRQYKYKINLKLIRTACFFFFKSNSTELLHYLINRNIYIYKMSLPIFNII